MSYKFNPFTGTLDDVGPNGGAGVPGGSTTQVQFNDGGVFGGDVDLTWDKTTNVLGVAGDINLSDGGTYTTTVQCVTPTANRTISFPDATGTVALVAGSSGQLLWNNAGANAGVANSTVGSTGNITLSLAGAASTPPVSLTGTWYTGGTATTTKPQVLIEPTGTTSTAWSTSGTGLGVNAASGFAGNLLDLQVNGTSKYRFDAIYGLNVPTTGVLSAGTITVAQWNATLGLNASFLRLDVANQDVVLVRDAGGVFAQRNGTNAQTFRVYNTYTDASNYERLSTTWSSNVCYTKPENAGTGSARLYVPVTGSTTVASLPSASTAGAGARAFVTDANATTFLSTVAGGGANKVPVVSDGTNWLIG